MSDGKFAIIILSVEVFPSTSSYHYKIKARWAIFAELAQRQCIWLTEMAERKCLRVAPKVQKMVIGSNPIFSTSNQRVVGSNPMLGSSKRCLSSLKTRWGYTNVLESQYKRCRGSIPKRLPVGAPHLREGWFDSRTLARHVNLILKEQESSERHRVTNT